eukprot:1071801-Pyramimonas_sp.AAC.1
MVVGLKVGEKLEAFVADRLPQKLDDAIEGNHCKFYDAAQMMSPEELLELIPPSFPTTHLVKGCAMVAKYPVDAWERAGRKSFLLYAKLVRAGPGDLEERRGEHVQRHGSSLEGGERCDTRPRG